MDEACRRRVAIQIAAQLPESTEDALAVLRLASELVETFLEAKPPPGATSRAAVVDHPACFLSRRILPTPA